MSLQNFVLVFLQLIHTKKNILLQKFYIFFKFAFKRDPYPLLKRAGKTIDVKNLYLISKFEQVVFQFFGNMPTFSAQAKCKTNHIGTFDNARTSFNNKKQTFKQKCRKHVSQPKLCSILSSNFFCYTITLEVRTILILESSFQKWKSFSFV